MSRRLPLITPAPALTAESPRDTARSRRQDISDISDIVPTPSASNIDFDPPPASASATQDPGGEGSSLPPSSAQSSQPSSDPPSSSPTDPPPSSQESSTASSTPPSSQPPSSSSVPTPTSTPSSSQQPSSSSSQSSVPESNTQSSSDGSSSSSAEPSFSSSSSVTPTQTLTNEPSFSFSAETTITTTFLTTINGVEQTITSAIPTTISTAPASSSDSHGKRAVIAGSVIGGLALIAIITSLIIFCKRKNYRKLRVFGHGPRSRSMLLAGEDFDDADPPMTRYRDYPNTPTSLATLPSRNVTPYADEQRIPLTAGSAISNRVTSSPPRLMGLRASESGSIFQEDVWPPPGEGSRFVDPILAGSSQVNLGGIVDDVMGSGNRRTPSPLRNPRPPSYHIRGGSSGSDPFRASPQPILKTSQTDLLHDGEPMVQAVTPPKLFVTNPTSPTTPETPDVPDTNTKTKNWLDRSPNPRSSLALPGNESSVSMGEAV